jgi:hypothetical protein
MSDEIVRRKVQRDCFCRGCDVELKKDVDEGIFTHSFRNRGQNIIFCIDCGHVIGDLASE